MPKKQIKELTTDHNNLIKELDLFFNKNGNVDIYLNKQAFFMELNKIVTKKINQATQRERDKKQSPQEFVDSIKDDPKKLRHWLKLAKAEVQEWQELVNILKRKIMLGKKISTNKKGYSFYIDDWCNDYAIRKLGKNYKVLIIAFAKKPIERILFKNNEPIYSTPCGEAMGIHIDILKLNKEKL